MAISILGCGWLGFPLAQYLLDQGYKIKGSTTTKEKLKELHQAGIEPYLINLPEHLNDEKSKEFWNSDVLILNIPPRRGNVHIEEDYPNLIQKITKKAAEAGIQWIIFASSTSVYSETGGVTGEEDANPGEASGPAGEAVLAAEQVLQRSKLDITILRFGGLYGYERHPVQYLAGKKNLTGASKPVNLIHQTDCINVIHAILNADKRNTIYNVVADGHPPRKEFYQSAARYFNLPVPTFKKDSKSDYRDYRVVSNQKLKDELGLKLSYPNPMDHT